MSDYKNKTVAELKNFLRERSLSVSGRKDELIKRLQDDDESTEPSPTPEPVSSTASLMSTPYSKLTVVQLQDELKKRHLVHTGVKPQLIKRLLESDLRSTSNIDINAEDLKLYKSPFQTLKYFFYVVVENFCRFLNYSIHHKRLIGGLIILFSVITLFRELTEYRDRIVQAESLFLWYGWWVALGVASSIGLGTGLHTFVLYLGPFIARVAVLVYECNSLDFSTRGKDSFICGKPAVGPISLIDIYKKVMFEALAWGAGTAIGELPPYFVARGGNVDLNFILAALAGKEDEDLSHIEELSNKPKHELKLFEKIQLFMLYLLERFGFWGIFLAASIPNPLFDLAGITCGHFLIPFSTFFGATFLGKAFVKASIQAWSMILLFSKESIDTILNILKDKNENLYMIFSNFLAQQKATFSKTEKPTEVPETIALIPTIWNGFITLMILYFVVSIIESLAQGYVKKHKGKKI